MNSLSKVVFWIFTIILGFVNPLISVILVILYYLPRIIQDACNPEETLESSGMKSFSDDILEDMK